MTILEIGKLVSVFEADTRKFDSGVRGVEGKLALIKAQLLQTTTGVNGVTSSLGGLSTRMGIAAGGAVILGSALSGAVAGLFALVKSSAEAGGELFDLSQKTNFGVKTLSGLSIVARTTGTDIKTLSTSLGLFQKNMDAANDVTSRQGELFRRLNIDTLDNEKALRQAFTQLDKLGDGAHQTAAAMQLFGRSGKDVLAIIKETNGDLDKAIARYDKMGLVISHGAAVASDKFNDTLEETQLQLSAVTRSIGLELLPVATESLQQISFWLAENKDAWSRWGSTTSDVLRGVKSIADSEIGSIIGALARLSAEISGIPGIVRGLGGIGAGLKPQEDFYGPGGAARGGRRSLPGTSEYLAAQRRLAGMADRGLGGLGGRGRGGGGSARTDPSVTLLKQLEEQFRQLTPRTEAQITAEKLLGSEYARTLDALKKKILITAMDIDAQKKILELTRERIATGIEEREEFQKMVNLVLEAGQQGGAFFSRRRTMNDLTGLLGTDATRPRSIADGATRPRVATVDETVLRERLAMIRDEMHGLSADLTTTFDRALYDGISGGGMRGLESLTLGFGDMIQQVVLGRLREALAEALTAGASGSGWIAKLLRWFVPAVAGGVGGSIGGGGATAAQPGWGSGIGSFAEGGFLKPGSWGMVGERGPEMVYGGHSGMTVIPNGGKQQVANNYSYSIQLPPSSKGSYQSRSSQRELADRLLAALQGAQS